MTWTYLELSGGPYKQWEDRVGGKLVGVESQKVESWKFVNLKVGRVWSWWEGSASSVGYWVGAGWQTFHCIGRPRAARAWHKCHRSPLALQLTSFKNSAACTCCRYRGRVMEVVGFTRNLPANLLWPSFIRECFLGEARWESWKCWQSVKAECSNMGQQSPTVFLLAPTFYKLATFFPSDFEHLCQYT